MTPRDAIIHGLSKDVQQVVEGTITEGMLPKVHACLDALEQEIGQGPIIADRIPHAILLEVFTPQRHWN